VNSTLEKRLLSILVNDDFINYVLNPDLILKERWEDYLIAHPEDIPLVTQARQILLGESDPKELTPEEAFDLEQRILNRCDLTTV